MTVRSVKIWLDQYEDRILSCDLNKAHTVSKMISTQYISVWNFRRSGKTNPEGHCILCPDKNIPCGLEQLLTSCHALDDKRENLSKINGITKQQTISIYNNL